MNKNDILSQSAHRLASAAVNGKSLARPRHLEVDTIVMSARTFLDHHGIDARSLDPAALRELRYGIHVAIDRLSRCVVGIHVESFPRSEVSIGLHRHTFKRVGYLLDVDAGSSVN